MRCYKSITALYLSTFGICVLLLIAFSVKHYNGEGVGPKIVSLKSPSVGPPVELNLNEKHVIIDHKKLMGTTVTTVTTSDIHEQEKVLNTVAYSADIQKSKQATAPMNLTPKVEPTMPYLISENKPVTSDVRGNLGEASCITSEVIIDWLTDRWQGLTLLTTLHDSQQLITQCLCFIAVSLCLCKCGLCDVFVIGIILLVT